MIPVVAPPLDEPPAPMRRFMARQQTKDDAPQDQIPRPTDVESGDRRSPSRWLSRHRADQWRPRTPAPTVVIGLSAAALLAAATIRRKHESRCAGGFG
jgi:hypothetical protein